METHDGSRIDMKHPCESCECREICGVEENALAPGMIVVTCAVLAALLVVLLVLWRWLAC